MATLRETVTGGDVKLFTITAHAMKSALANIGEPEKAELAFALEKAGQRADTEYIAANLGSFLETLESLTQSLIRPEKSGKDGVRAAEDKEFLPDSFPPPGRFAPNTTMRRRPPCSTG